jgi:Co/Zn/Cd efflux system component
MRTHCCSVKPTPPGAPPTYTRALWIALAANALMFTVESGASFVAGSTALLADAADFFGDAANYGASLGALALGGLWVSRVALAKGLTMAAFGLGVIGLTAGNALRGVTPEPVTMGAVAALALAVNVGVAVLLYRFRSGEANMRSVWLCSRNDAIGNLAVLLAAAGVFGSGSAWPDWIVAGLMAVLALQAGIVVVRQARAELAQHGHAAHPAATH